MESSYQVDVTQALLCKTKIWFYGAHNQKHQQEKHLSALNYSLCVAMPFKPSSVISGPGGAPPFPTYAHSYTPVMGAKTLCPFISIKYCVPLLWRFMRGAMILLTLLGAVLQFPESQCMFLALVTRGLCKMYIFDYIHLRTARVTQMHTQFV